MIIERLGEASPVLHEMLEALGAEIDGDRIIIPTHGIRKTGDNIIKRLGKASPLLHEILEALGAEIVIPTHGIRKTEDGLEVNVHYRFCRFDEGKWLPLRRVNARTVP